MKIIIKFEGSNEVFKKALNKEVNGFINQCLGKDNPYHGNFSRYCISSMQGGRMNKNGELLFKNDAYLQVSTDSDNTEFINRLINGLSDTANGMAIKSLKYKDFEVSVFQPYHKFDIIRTISPLYLTNKDKSLTFKDEDFLKVLRNKLVIEHKDRLTRFQFKFIKKMFESYGCEVIVINGMDVSDTEELAADMMSLLASFSGKFYGKRSAERRKKNKETKSN